MYGWIWRHLPGPPPARAFVAAALVVAALALLWFVAFPAVDTALPFVAVDVSAQ